MFLRLQNVEKMNSNPAKRKEFKPLTRSGYSNGELYQSTVINGFVQERPKKARRKTRHRKRSTEAEISSNM